MYKQLRELNPTIYLVALMVVSAFLCVLCVHEGHVWGDDFSLYIAQAKSILDGTTADLLQKNIYLTDNSEIIEGGPIGPYLYPTGFPFLLSGIYALKGLDFVAMKLMCVLFFISALPIVYALFSIKFNNKKYALLLTSYIALNFAFISFSDNVLSDFPFFFLTVLGIYLIEKNKLNVVYQLSLTTVIIASYLIRDVGIFFIPILITQLFFKSRETSDTLINYFKKNYLFLLPIAFFSVFFLTKGLFLKTYNSNLMTALFAASIKTILTNTAYYIYILGELLGIKNNIPLGLAIMSVFSIVFLNGVYRSKKEDWYLVLLIALTMGLYIVFPGRQGLRYLFPIVPCVFYFFINGILKLPFYFLQKSKKNILIALAIYIGLSGLFLSVQFKNTSTNDITTPEAIDMYKWIKTNALNTDIVAFEEPRLLRLMTDRNSFMHHDDAKIINSKAAYFVEHNKPIKNNAAFTPIYQNKTFVVYKLNR